jgi:hypothetical protein
MEQLYTCKNISLVLLFKTTLYTLLASDKRFFVFTDRFMQRCVQRDEENDGLSENYFADNGINAQFNYSLCKFQRQITYQKFCENVGNRSSIKQFPLGDIAGNIAMGKCTSA